MNAWVIVVTYNRKDLLLRCVNSLFSQTLPVTRILVVDNASTDGTVNSLNACGWLDHPCFELLQLTENTGGAGGFEAGMRHAINCGAEWVWLMDDDAFPHHDAFEHLSKECLDPGNLYGSVAVTGSRLSWPMSEYGRRPPSRICNTSELPQTLNVEFIPFLGLLVSAQLVDRIGYPDGAFFLAADDVDFCMRARKGGAQILLIGASRLEHPLADVYAISLPWRKLYNLRLPPWKRYYDTRNRIFVARNHYGLALYYKTIPGSFLRLYATLLHETDRRRQLVAFFSGLTDGLLGRKGRRHTRWGL